jgi:DNA-binding CsgD family transcriptional regulator
MARLASARIAIHKRDYVAANDELETAWTLLLHRDRPLLSAHVRLELARAFAGSGDHAGALVEVEAAMATFERLGVVPDLARCAAMLVNLRDIASETAESRSQPRLVTGNYEKLTRRESEIARMVAQGLTNREIAARLVLSVRTVETHVDRVLGKLDFHSRTQLATWVIQEPTARVT